METETTIEPVETDTAGDAAAPGNGNASSAPGIVTRDGVSDTSLLGPDGTVELVEPTAGTPRSLGLRQVREIVGELNMLGW